MSGGEEGSVVHEIEIDAPPEEVFAYLVDPERMCRWLGLAVELDPRPGGALRIDVNGRDVVRGEYLEVEPPRRVVFTWGWDREATSIPPGTTTVEVTLTPSDGGTRLRLVHRGLPDDVRQEHDQGWAHYLARLAIAGAGGDPGPDPLARRDIVHGSPGSAPSEIDRDTEPEKGEGSDERGRPA